MYQVITSSQNPVEGDNWQNSFLKDYEWVVLKKVKSEEPQENESSEVSPAFLVLKTPDSGELLSNEGMIIPTNESLTKNEVLNFKAVYKCDTCKKQFKRRKSFNNHKCEINYKKKSTECRICGKSFFDYSTLMRHVQLHTGIKPYECNICLKTFSRKDNFKSHCKLHSSKKSILCDIGKKRVINAPLEFKRRLTAADYQNPFTCEDCDKKFARKSSLAVHRRIHLPFKCHLCNNSFSMKRQVVAHLRTHGSLEPSKRTLSWKLVLQNSKNNRNQKNASGTKENHAFQCKLCQKVFPLRSNLIEHERVHTGLKPFECDICYKKVSSRGILNVHRRIHTGERPYQCPFCPKAFIEKTKLNIHMRYHTGIKPYECIVCHKKFSRRQYLKNHFRIHTGERPFECDICHKTFIEKSAHNRHKKTHYS